jgi:hypothetical protein
MNDCLKVKVELLSSGIGKFMGNIALAGKIRWALFK